MAREGTDSDVDVGLVVEAGGFRHGVVWVVTSGRRQGSSLNV